MSDPGRPDGWWLASDGRWYPPPEPRRPEGSVGQTGATSQAHHGQPRYQSGQQGPPGYGGPAAYESPAAHGTQPAGQTSGKATAVMVLGISSIVLMCAYGIGIIPAIVALVLARGARREIAASGGWLGGADQIRTGTICAWISVALTGLAVLAVLFTLLILILAALPPG
ncbi:hypothetical protein [Rhabdothermincola salaria]|uniref:hypothetical protein n=1 Tax=Rhabdothermincola salaria TaxID=2903142 RepID=UPI001E391369|nr:hypothetical protein [Rhabdothermincola salaria]MCD9623966.1 hypothetical protein [Rhabdothermincola salaria]